MKKGKTMKIIKKVLKWALILMALYVVYIVGFVYFTGAIPMKPTTLAQSPRGIAVFTGTRARLVEGFETLRKFPDCLLLISGVNEGTKIPYLIKVSKVPCCPREDHITLDYQAQDTTENAQETARWAYAKGLHQLCLITSNYHMPRSLLELGHYAPDLQVIPHPVIAKSFQNDTWWRNKEVVYTVLEEYNKYLLAWLRYKFESYFA